LIHADKHGFLVVPPEDEARLLEAARFMDDNECQTMIAAARASAGKSTAEILTEFDTAAAQFGNNTVNCFGHKGEAASGLRQA
jgi:regulator of RNase E activity RraA